MSISLSSTIRFAIVALLVAAIGYIVAPNQAAAQVNIPAAGVDLEGFAWSPTVGWISFNCTNNATCAADGGIDYAVTLDSSGNLVNHAWTSSIGWIDFNPAGPYPGGSGVTNLSARAIGGDFTGNLIFGGWARACAVFANPSACSGPLDPNAGGWDGWISLSGSASGGYAVTMTPTGATANSYAWGGPLVTGWIDFSPIGSTPVRYAADPAPVVTILTPTAPQPAGPVTITFDPIGPGGGTPDSCEISDGSTTSPITLNSPVTNAESVTVTALVDTVYTITCTNPSGSGSDSVTVDVYGDLVLGPVTVTPGSVNAAGDYDTVNFTANVSGVPAGTPVPYRLELDGQSDITGTLNGSGVLVIDEDFTSVPFSATPLAWTLTVDPTSGGAPNGSVFEGGGAAEDNIRTGTLTLSAPDPTITIDVDSIVRTGTTADVVITISTVGETTCQLFGPGLTGTSFTVPAGSVNETNTYTTDPLQNSTNVAIECSVAGGGSPVTQGASIEVTPSFQEV